MSHALKYTCLAYLASLGGLSFAPVAELPPLLDLENSVQQLDADTVRLEINLNEAFTYEEKPRNLNLVADWSNGAAGAGWGNAPGWNRAKHESKIISLDYTGSSISGEIAVTLLPDRWVPEDQQPIELSVRFQGKVKQLFGPNDQAYDAAYWADPAKSAGKLATVEGTFKVSSSKLGATSGSLTGSRLPNAPGKWNKGQKSADGVHVGFDMGTKRVNWTNMRDTRIDFTRIKDLSSFGGLRVGIATDQPRTDAAVSVWLKEADGSWYYYSRGVPLNAATNSADLCFADFEEAEWVNP